MQKTNEPSGMRTRSGRVEPATGSGVKAGARSGRRRPLQRVANGVTYLRTLIVNVYFVEAGKAGEWVLVDAGLPGSGGVIVAAAERVFGRESRPSAIVLTHGHFDHVGALKELAEYWNVPVFAHRLERPYLNGESPYPPPDPSVGGGLMARVSPLYPRGPIDVSTHLQLLPEDGTVPPLPGWRWIHTPGHTAGHISLFRDEDRTLIAGDAFISVNQESALEVARQRPEVSGPPAYYTQDWNAARESVERLRRLRPAVAATGHGIPMRGRELELELDELAQRFDELAVPRRGRYVERPVVADESGPVSIPPARGRGRALLIGLGVAAVAGTLLFAGRRSGSISKRGRREM